MPSKRKLASLLSSIELQKSVNYFIVRCSWVNIKNPVYVDYHDKEWGRINHDEKYLFEMLNLEGAQAGLSWETVLKKRENYRMAFDDWDVEKIILYDNDKVADLLLNPGIIRNKLKTQAIITNAIAYKKLCQNHGSLDSFLWSFVPERVPIYPIDDTRIITSELSDVISKELKKLGFKFVGSTIIYAYLQAIGICNDHDSTCAFHCSRCKTC